MTPELLAYAAFFLTMALSYSIMSQGLNLQWGQTGVFNVGIAGFVAIGAYASALLTTPLTEGRLGGLGLPIAVGWAGAAVAAGVVSLVIGAITMRLRSDYLAIATFGVAVAVQLAALNLEAITGGPFGIAQIPRPFGELAGNGLAFGLANLGLVLLVVLGVHIGLDRLVRGPWGRVLRAIREDETAAVSLGKNAIRFRLEAFAIGGAVMGLAGAVQAHFIGFIAPDNYQPILTFQVWAMLIVGGSGNAWGAIFGAVLVWAIWAASGAVIADVFPAEQQARAATLQIVMIGIALCIMLLAKPRGLWPERPTVSRYIEKLGRRGASGKDA
jgi:branched-chain amino acid transport system permease protein